MLEPLIRLSNVSIIKNGKTILNNIDWIVSPGENWAVLGRNGSGKSFLLRLLTAEQYPSAGTVELLGKKLGEVSIWDLRKHIGIVSDLLQKEYNNKTTVIDVIYSGFFASIGLYDDITDDMKRSVERLSDFLNISHLKNRIFGELSHGEQRRVLIARALIFDPKLLVLDEPCTGLDIIAREEFLATLSSLLKKGHNIILVTHHVEEIIPEINSILLLKEGRIEKRGNLNDIMPHLHELFGQNFRLKNKDNRIWLEKN